MTASEGASRLWHDPQERHRLFDRILIYWQVNDRASLISQLSLLDTAIVEGLRAYGLARAPVASIRPDVYYRGWIGRTLPSCEIQLDTFLIAESIRHGAPDKVFATLLHESQTQHVTIGTGDTMTGREYIDRIRELVRQDCFHEARALGHSLFAPDSIEVRNLTRDEFIYLTDLMSMIDRVVEAMDASEETSGSRTAAIADS